MKRIEEIINESIWGGVGREKDSLSI